MADSFTTTASYGSLEALAADLRAMGEVNVLTARLRHPTRRAVFRQAAKVYSAAHGVDGTRIKATFELICLTGWAPHQSQQTPLRPGSAKHRLADALNVAERHSPTDG